MVSERVLLSYHGDMTVQCIRPGTVCGFSPRMRADLVVNMLTMQALTKGEITVLGGDQQRPVIHMDDMVDVYLFCIERGAKLQGIYNASFENLTVREIADIVIRHVPAELKVAPSNDPRSYRMCSDKIMAAGFKPKKNAEQAVVDIIGAYRKNLLKDQDAYYNVRWMKRNIF